MTRSRAASGDDRTVLLLDSVTEIDAADIGSVVVTGSHGGASAVHYATAVALTGCFFNDAGIGKDAAGIGGLALLACPGAAYGHDSARIGDARDGWDNGIITAVNPPAAAAGLRAGQSVREAAAILLRG
jgi:hypothetical protein